MAEISVSAGASATAVSAAGISPTGAAAAAIADLVALEAGGTESLQLVLLEAQLFFRDR